MAPPCHVGCVAPTQPCPQSHAVPQFWPPTPQPLGGMTLSDRSHRRLGGLGTGDCPGRGRGGGTGGHLDHPWQWAAQPQDYRPCLNQAPDLAPHICTFCCKKLKNLLIRVVDSHQEQEILIQNIAGGISAKRGGQLPTERTGASLLLALLEMLWERRWTAGLCRGILDPADGVSAELGPLGQQQNVEIVGRQPPCLNQTRLR